MLLSHSSASGPKFQLIRIKVDRQKIGEHIGGPSPTIYGLFLSYFSSKIVIHVGASPADKRPGPVVSSTYDFIRLSFSEGGLKEVSAVYIFL